MAVPNPAPPGRTKKLIYFSLVIIIVAILWFLYWFLVLRFYESTDDAYANGSMITINAAVPGSVVAFYADDTDLVKEGDLLVLLDETPYKIAYERELAALATSALHVRQLYDDIPIRQADLQNKRIAWRRARYDFENRSQLIGSQAVSNEDFTHSKDAYHTALYDSERAEGELQQALNAVGTTPAENHPEIEAQKARVITAYYNLWHTKIYAPATGFVAQRAIDVGEYAGTASPLMAIIPKTYVWVDANFKETQLTKMRIGQEATVWFDLYGSHVTHKGKVLGIASGTGSIFSIIPPQNATGNWIKIVQRLPVRISLDPEILEKYPTRLGISANVDVNITDQDGPWLAMHTPAKPVTTTAVFQINLEDTKAKMDAIIKKNLEQHDGITRPESKPA